MKISQQVITCCIALYAIYAGRYKRSFYLIKLFQCCCNVDFCAAPHDVSFLLYGQAELFKMSCDI